MACEDLGQEAQDVARATVGLGDARLGPLTPNGGPKGRDSLGRSRGDPPPASASAQQTAVHAELPDGAHHPKGANTEQTGEALNLLADSAWLVGRLLSEASTLGGTAMAKSRTSTCPWSLPAPITTSSS